MRSSCESEEAGIQCFQEDLGSRFRGSDEKNGFSTVWKDLKMVGQEVFRFKALLRQMGKRDLFKMAFSQKERNCLLGGACPFLLEYHRILFCVSEILGQGCQIEKLRLLSDENAHSEDEISLKAVKLAIGPCLPGLG